MGKREAEEPPKAAVTVTIQIPPNFIAQWAQKGVGTWWEPTFLSQFQAHYERKFEL